MTSFVRSSLETLWIFKVARWTYDRCTKINKSPTISNGIRSSSFEIWTANLAQSLTLDTLTNPRSFIFGDSNWKFGSRLPRRHPTWQLTFRCWHFWLGIKIKNMLLFLSEKSCILGSFGTVTSLRMGFRSERAAAGLGPSGLMEFSWLTKISENLTKKN